MEGGKPLSVRERQESLRARRAMFGMTEVRGIYLHPDDHEAVKRYAKRLRDRQLKLLARDTEPVGLTTWCVDCGPKSWALTVDLLKSNYKDRCPHCGGELTMVKLGKP